MAVVMAVVVVVVVGDWVFGDFIMSLIVCVIASLSNMVSASCVPTFRIMVGASHGPAMSLNSFIPISRISIPKSAYDVTKS